MPKTTKSFYFTILRIFLYYYERRKKSTCKIHARQSGLIICRNSHPLRERRHTFIKYCQRAGSTSGDDFNDAFIRQGISIELLHSKLVQDLRSSDTIRRSYVVYRYTASAGVRRKKHQQESDHEWIIITRRLIHLDVNDGLAAFSAVKGTRMSTRFCKKRGRIKHETFSSYLSGYSGMS